MELESRVEAFVRRHGIFAPGSRIVVACSGGPDSLALASILLSLREKWRLSLRIAHFEHGIRGAASLADAEFVCAFAEQEGVPCSLVQEDIPAYAKRARISLETAARERRYAFLAETAKKMGADALIATGHHAGDQAETVLMHILRGAGIDGLAGMRPRSGRIVRPLLFLSREEIAEYCRDKGLQPRQDETNFLPDAERNRIRLELLPMLRRYRPSLDDALCRLAAAEAEAAGFLREAASAVWTQAAEERSGEIILHRKAYGAGHAALRKALLRRAAETLGLRLSLGFSHYEALDEFCRFGETGKKLTLPEGGEAECRYDKVVLRRAAKQGVSWTERPLALFGVTRVEEIGLTVYASSSEGAENPTDSRLALADLDVLESMSSTLVVRSRQEGDSFRLENGGRQKVKSLLIDRKIPRELRERVPIFAAGDEIFWVGGVRRAAVALVTAETRRRIAFRMVWDDGSEEKMGGEMTC